VNDVELCYQILGPADAPPCLLVMGLGAQMIVWPDGLLSELLERGFQVIRFDNRDVGLSSKTDGPPPDVLALIAAHEAGETIEAPYTLSDMADDALGLLAHLGFDEAHVVGASLGGMVAQHLALEHPERVASLTSIMSAPGPDDLVDAEPEALGALLSPAPEARAAAIEHNVNLTRLISGPLYDEAVARDRAREQFDRAYTPAAGAFQLAAMGASGDRTDRLGQLSCPTLVVHGRVDPLIKIEAGLATAAAAPEADLLVLGRMGHDLPRLYWPQVADAIIGIARRSE